MAEFLDARNGGRLGEIPVALVEMPANEGLGNADRMQFLFDLKPTSVFNQWMRFLLVLFVLAFGCSESTSNVCLVSDPGGISLGQASSLQTSNTTVGAGDNHTPPMGCVVGDRSEAPDRTFTWTAPAAGTYRIDTIGSDFDAVVVVYRGRTSGELAGCDDDSAGIPNAELLLEANACETFAIVVDGWSEEEGNFVLNIAPAGVPSADAGPEG